MLGIIRSYFERQVNEAADGDGAAGRRERAFQLATAALLIEMSRADFEVTPAERAAVSGAIRRAFDLGEEQARELVTLAEAEADRATSLYEFTRLINDHFTARQKEHVVELMWHVAYADGELDKYEDHLVRKVADLLYVPHRFFIRAKLNAKARWETAQGSKPPPPAE